VRRSRVLRSGRVGLPSPAADPYGFFDLTVARGSSPAPNSSSQGSTASARHSVTVERSRHSSGTAASTGSRIVARRELSTSEWIAGSTQSGWKLREKTIEPLLQRTFLGEHARRRTLARERVATTSPQLSTIHSLVENFESASMPRRVSPREFEATSRPRRVQSGVENPWISRRRSSGASREKSSRQSRQARSNQPAARTPPSPFARTSGPKTA